jgi:hypothetical protein
MLFRVLCLLIYLSVGVDAMANNRDYSVKISVYNQRPQITSIDPSVLEYYYQQFFLHNLGDTLIRFDFKNRIIAGLAESWAISRDKRQIALRLRSDVLFSDGKPLTADDVAVTIKRACLKKSNFHFRIHEYIEGCQQLKKITDNMSGIRVDSATSVTLTFNQQVSDLIEKLAFSELVILPSHAIDSDTLAIDWRISIGPYSVLDWHTDKVVLKMNSNSPLSTDGMPSIVEVLPNNGFDGLQSIMKDDGVQIVRTNMPMRSNIAESPIYNTVFGDFSFINFLIMNPYDKSLADLDLRREIVSRIHTLNYKDLPSKIFTKANSVFPPIIAGSEILKYPDRNSKIAGDLSIQVLINPKHKGLKSDYYTKKFKERGINASFVPMGYADTDSKVLNHSFQSLIMVCGVSSDFVDGFFSFFMNPKLPYFFDPDKIIDQFYKKMTSSSSLSEKNRYANMILQQLIDQGTLVPLIFESIPFFITKDLQLVDQSRFTEDISLWKIRQKQG